jgi:hypothetical protein
LIGAALINLKNFPIPTQYGNIELERMYFHILDYAEEAVNTETMTKIKEYALLYL